MDFEEYKLRMKKEFNKLEMLSHLIEFPNDEILLIHFLNNVVISDFEMEALRRENRIRGDSY